MNSLVNSFFSFRFSIHSNCLNDTEFIHFFIIAFNLWLKIENKINKYILHLHLDFNMNEVLKIPSPKNVLVHQFQPNDNRFISG